MTSSSRDILADLVAFDTTSARSNLPLIAYVQRFLAECGVSAEVIPDETGEKASLFATMGTVRGGGVVLSGHTDCVPVDGQAWSSDPFTLTERDGNLYGRGSADMKGFIACALNLVRQRAGATLERPLHLAFSHDEEIGCSGVHGMLGWLKAQPWRPASCLVGEPTLMRAILGHKGGRAYRCTIEGLAAHSALTPYGVNAIEHAAAIIARITALGGELAAGPQDDGFDVPFSTISVGRIEGGTAINIVPERCSFVFEFRNLPAVEQEPIAAAIESFARETVLPAMRQRHASAAIRFAPIYAYPGHSIDPASAWAREVTALLDDPGYSKVAFGTEAGLFQRELRLPTVICGPGSINVAHKPDEHVALAQLDACDRMLARLIR